MNGQDEPATFCSNKNVNNLDKKLNTKINLTQPIRNSDKIKYSDNQRLFPCKTQLKTDVKPDSGKEIPDIKLGFWNIEGLYEKLNFEGLCDYMQTFDILGLGETFTLPGFDFSIKFPDHLGLHCPAKKYTKLGRPSGGLVLLIRKSLAKYREIVETNISHVLAIKIKKNLF